MIEWLDIAWMFSAGLIGYILGRRKWRPPRPPVEPKAICQCDHAYALHDNDGVCHGRTEEPTHWDGWGDPKKFHYIPCNCQKYVGPEPLPRYISGD